MYLPIGIFGVSVATAALPDLAKQAAEGARDAMASTLSWALRLMMVLSIPATVGLIVLSGPIIELVFQRGEFDAASTWMTASALAFYAPGILGYSIVKIAAPAFYSLRDARTPVYISLVTIAVNLGLNLWLNSIYGFRGLALGTAISASLNAAALLWLLSRRLGGGDFPRIGVTFAKSVAASAAMGAAAWWTHGWLVEVVPDPSFWSRLLRVVGAIGTALVVLAGMAHLLRLQEFGDAMSRVVSRLKR
jgi:putative peptidoglycan lipid II flippase